MNPDPEHDEIRVSLGAFALDALDGHDREHIADHLTTCPECRDELAQIATMPARLATLVAAPSPASTDRFLAAALARRRARHRAHRLWQITAIAAALVALVALTGIVHRSTTATTPTGLALTALGPSTGAAAGTIATVARPWGTEVQLTARMLASSARYRIWAVDRSGHREIAATWSATPANSYRVIGATGIRIDDIVRIEITTDSNEPLLVHDT